MDVAWAFPEVTLDGARRVEGLQWGEHDLSRWETVLATLARADLAGPVDVSQIATNDYVDEINDFDENAIRAEAEAA